MRAVKTVGFDTATDDTVVAGLDGDRVVAERTIAPGDSGRPLHSQTLLQAAGEAADALGGWGEVDRIAVGLGPGTFTGIRIGIATAGGLSLSTGVPAVGVSTLAALAMTISRESGADGPVMPVLDARRGEVFAGLYNHAGRELEPPFVGSPDDLAARIREFAARLPRPPLVGGPGAVRFAGELDRAGIDTPGLATTPHRLSGRAICELGAGAARSQPGKPLEPIYLRVPDAQLWLQRDGRDPGPD
ncbi:MAG: tRNA (adenosine(37)-N6)-threonylcarbamoyltransferase complex dimerization subunit type 1 TsaB [Actinomycetota bacterium]|nr:tRNA (adenosine(37)-N6)-threonylcarbamoyltransferase complex dimerization subunit type 1 TsaB [Actinomycetota bacterium]